MAVNLFNEYPQNTQAPSEDYPFGAFRNRTAPEAADGTTLEEKWSNDWQAFFSRLFIEASMTPSGEVDTVKVSQYYDALLTIIQREKVEVSNDLDGNRTDVAASEDALRRTHELASSKVSKSGDTMTGSLALQNTQPMLELINSSIPENNVGSRVVLWNNVGNPTVTTTNRSWSGTAFNQVFPRKSGTVALTSDVSSKVSKSGDTMTGDLILQNKLSLRSVGVPANSIGSLFKFENESGTLVIRRGRADGSTNGETRIVMPNRAGTVALEQDMFGVGQKWVDVTGARAGGATYKNDTGKAMSLSVWMNQNWGGGKSFTVFIDGINVVHSDTGTASDPSVFAIIPAGSTYRVEILGVSLGSSAFWFEMR